MGPKENKKEKDQGESIKKDIKSGFYTLNCQQLPLKPLWIPLLIKKNTKVKRF